MVKRLADDRWPTKLGIRVTAVTDDASPLMVKRLADDRRPTKLGIRVTAVTDDASGVAVAAMPVAGH
jgi:hypothetical protein